jgi:uncharacterized protein (DUF4415 family)
MPGTKSKAKGRGGYTRRDLAAVASPELTDTELAEMKPAAEILPKVLLTKLKRRGPQKALTKAPVSIRLDRDLVQRLRQSGKGWQSRANSLLRKAVGLK